MQKKENNTTDPEKIQKTRSHQKSTNESTEKTATACVKCTPRRPRERSARCELTVLQSQTATATFYFFPALFHPQLEQDPTLVTRSIPSNLSSFPRLLQHCSKQSTKKTTTLRESKEQRLTTPQSNGVFVCVFPCVFALWLVVCSCCVSWASESWCCWRAKVRESGCRVWVSCRGRGFNALSYGSKSQQATACTKLPGDYASGSEC